MLDNGNVAGDARKLAAVLRIMGMDHYDAVGTGALDLCQAAAYARAAPPNRIPLVRAVPRGDDLDRLCSDLFVKKLRGHAIGVTALPPAPEASGEKYLGTAVHALREARGRCEILVLLSQLGLERDKELARRCGSQGPHVIIGNLDAVDLPGPLQVESSVIVPTGPGATRVGILEIVFPLMGPPRVDAVQVVPARAEGEGHPAVTAMITAFYAEEQERFLKTVDSRLLQEKMAEGAGDETRCGRCHEEELRTWKATKHARAVDTLIRRKRMVPECLVCHSTRYRETGVFDRAARAGDVDCTGCHPAAGTGEKSACPEKSTRTHGAKACRVCHTVENSPEFYYGSYYPQVRHDPLYAPPSAPSHGESR